jgi:AcrR family transcriptional regulator
VPNGIAVKSAARRVAREQNKPTHAPTPRRRSQEERRSEAEERLLSAALTLLSRKGWVGMTLAEVGEAAGYSRGLATHHFGNKRALLRALTAKMHLSFAQDMQAAPSPSAGLQAVLGYVRVYLGRSDANWTIGRAHLLLLAESLLEDSDTAEVIAENNREIFEWLENNLRMGIEQGEVRRDVDPSLGAQFVVGAMRGLGQQFLLRGRTAHLRQIKEQVVQMVEQAFAAPSRREPRNKR